MLAVIAIASTLGLGAVAAPMVIGGSMDGSSGMMGADGMHDNPGGTHGMMGDSGGTCGDQDSMDGMMGDHDGSGDHEECESGTMLQHMEDCEGQRRMDCCEEDEEQEDEEG
jgi:hypothetical protein